MSVVGPQDSGGSHQMVYPSGVPLVGSGSLSSVRLVTIQANSVIAARLAAVHSMFVIDTPSVQSGSVRLDVPSAVGHVDMKVTSTFSTYWSKVDFIHGCSLSGGICTVKCGASLLSQRNNGSQRPTPG